jgi:hypothetical protein
MGSRPEEQHNENKPGRILIGDVHYYYCEKRSGAGRQRLGRVSWARLPAYPTLNENKSVTADRTGKFRIASSMQRGVRFRLPVRARAKHKEGDIYRDRGGKTPLD